MKTEVRALRPGDMQSFADLCESRDNLDRAASEKRAEIVEWVAFHNPYPDGNPTYFVGAQGDRLMAHLGRMPCIFMIQGRPETASYFHDLYVHPALRKEAASGFFLSMQLYRHCEKASKSFCAMIWTNQINISLQQARKYKQMWMDQRVLLLGVSEKLEQRLPSPLLAPARLATRGLLRAIHQTNAIRLPKGARVEQIERFDSRFDELAERAAPTMGIAPRKDHIYLNWKYVDRPHLDASIFQLLDASGTLIGFSVLVAPDPSLTSAIAELIVVDKDRSHQHALLGHAIDFLGRQGADRVEAVATDPSYSLALHERLFRRDIRIPLFMTCTERSPNEKLLSSPSHWHVSLGDSEGPF